MLQSAQNHSNWFNKINMPKNTTACRIKRFKPVENGNVEKLRFTKINTKKFSMNSNQFVIFNPWKVPWN